jgi:hypothetical protein
VSDGKDGGVPPTFGWYRDTANWLVGLSTGALALGAGAAERAAGAGAPARALYTLGALGFLAALVSGVMLYAGLNGWGSCWLELRDLYDDPAAGAERIEAKRGELQAARRRVTHRHRALLWSFPVGALAAAALGLLGAWSPGARRAAAPTLVVDDSGRVWQVGGSPDSTLRAWRVPPPDPARAVRAAP